MAYLVLFLGVGFVLAALLVASNPSPYYGVVGLVFGSVVACGWLVSLGASFMSLVLFMVYLGGMLVVFVYSVSLAADPFPQVLGGWRTVGYALGVALGVGVGFVVFGWGEGFGAATVDSVGVFVVRLDFCGAALFYSCGAGLFLVAGWGLLLTLFVALELVRGLSRGAIRAV
uniref:NADH-ubiquinone oxidoreductase chain 6 n=2 Tax=Agapornis TaxID=60461 RepID=A0A6B8LN40_AGAPE|nr:NADH dehydrogenase subunit 6 [Agapornis nigrigenis]YP_009720946.1 NADH dehydrogenase subunit 6 [Agapornis pullarius]YP_009720959.1 NADH dehydrogenase subunit 6 [Agapornis lilianae]QCD14043.1 NADH dehydrogenase subunit 6 [Agapornis fischeri]QGM79718.1 NADH dehydrogenase subunit 6 [Agapornis personatus]QGM79705.1 NADH dehydrogenase subunit 6 [Agapornis nigrigenis]QGM79731.1 NADH dehydrogenase subunit 6 [Agapornis lilianae]